MKLRLLLPLLTAALVGAATLFQAADSQSTRKLLFFTKSATFEHSVISWKDGQPSHAEKVLIELGAANGWEFEFSKDGSKFSPEYLSQFDGVIFYTTGNLQDVGKDGHPAMTAAGEQALYDYVRNGGAFIGTHSASDTFHTANEADKGPDRWLNHGEDASTYVRMIGGEFIKHGKQQVAKNTVTNAAFPGFESVGTDYAFEEEWYSLKDFTPDIHVLSVIDAPAMEGAEYDRPPYPTTWARAEQKGRVFYTAMGHREDVWTNPIFQSILTGGLKWAMGDADAKIPANIETTAPGAYTNPPYVEPAPKPVKKPAAVGKP